jgi:hypothetical protein
MNTNENRLGVHLLDDAELEKVGTRVVGGNFDAAANLTSTLLGIAALATAAFCACMSPENRRSWQDTFMSNFSRRTASDVNDQAGDIEEGQGDANAAENLGNIELALDSSQNTDAEAIAAVRVIAFGTWTCNG